MKCICTSVGPCPWARAHTTHWLFVIDFLVLVMDYESSEIIDYESFEENFDSKPFSKCLPEFAWARAHTTNWLFVTRMS